MNLKDDKKINAGYPPPQGGDGGGDKAGNNLKKYGDMFEAANNLVFELAKELRRNMTEAERKLWSHLKQGIGGLKFRRQHPLKNYIADFYCHKIKLIIEADGGIHNKPDIKQYDENREADLKEWGYEVIRFKNATILYDEENVIRKISEKVDELKNKR
ncbi:MAG: endonuclease domain-containing protein [Chitinophagaceae bacterium]|nr:endonuclease domain-containing protein [Chitinophagaceae bacterium]